MSDLNEGAKNGQATRTMPNWRKDLLFYSDRGGWYADVKGHTQGQNQMVAGADTLIARFANGHNAVRVVLSAVYDRRHQAIDPMSLVDARPASDSDADAYLLRMRRIEHDPFGATYWVTQPGADAEEPPKKGNLLQAVAGRFARIFNGAPAWLCNVTHTVFGGEHPEHIFIHEIRPLDLAEKPTIVVDPGKAAGRY